MRCALCSLPVALVCVATARLPAAEVTAERSENGVTVKIDGQLFTEYLVRSGTKPILWPILGPGGIPMTRTVPMEKGAGRTSDHPHHRSLWFTHGSVNGVDFWAESGAKVGSIEHREFVKVQSGPQAVIIARNDWLGPGRKRICKDERTLTFGTDGPTRWIDVAIVVTATDGPVTFGDTKEGSFGIRVPDTMRVDAKQGGRIVNSRGQTDTAAWGKPAEWVDYHGPVDGQTLGIAVLNHPTSFRFPTGWHVRTYGLFAANPFAQQSFQGKGESAEGYTLAAGKTLALRWRVLLHRGDEKEGKVAEAFAAYAKQ
ncbi:MAG: PmoA family protein [Thermoguttaceae bacterium]|jgi:hypothetical protein